MRAAIRVRIAACFSAAALAPPAGAAPLVAQTVDVRENVPVARGLESRPLVEPHLAAHPANPNQLLGATIVSDAAAGDLAEGAPDTQICASFLSLDGGGTWKRHDFAITRCYDPWVAITPDGHAVFAALGVHKALTQQRQGGLVVFHSADGGRTWNPTPVGLGRGQDHPTIAVDVSSPERRGWLYVVSTDVAPEAGGKLRFGVTVAPSADGGRTFDAPVRIVPSNLNLNAEQAAVLSDGSLVVSFVDTQRRPLGGFAEQGGDLERRRAWVLRSTDGARTFSVPLFASESCAMGWTAMTADVSAGRFRDRLYFACKQKEGNVIVLSASSDSGETWTDPVPVHAAPANRAVMRERAPALAVNKHGVLGVSWMESHSRSGKRCQELYFAASLDGGRTFLPARRISSADSCPDAAVNGAAYHRWPTGGDYYGMSAAADGRFHLFWPDARAGVFQLWTAAVQVEGRH
jgi:hypothetical protein